MICPATGHAIHDPDGPYCGDHGARLFSNCPNCGSEWSMAWDPHVYGGEKGTDFCAQCGNPAPWLSRKKLIEWLKAQLADAGLETAKRLELQEGLDHIADMTPDDMKTVAGWERLRTIAPVVWDRAKPVIDAVVAAAVKKALGF
jgi:hypothetical protein